MPDPESSGGLRLPWSVYADVRRLLEEGERVTECGLAVETPLVWVWRCRDCGHDEVEPADGYACDRFLGAGDERADEDGYCSCVCQLRVLELRPRRPHGGSVTRDLSQSPVRVFRAVEEVARTVMEELRPIAEQLGPILGLIEAPAPELEDDILDWDAAGRELPLADEILADEERRKR